MKKKILNGGLVLLIVTLAIACNQKKEEVAAAPAVDNDQIKTEIQAIEDAFAVAYNAGNVDALTYYADDATSFANEKMPLVGKAAILASVKEDIANTPKGAKVSYVANEIYPSNDGNQVVEIGSYLLVDSTATKLRSGNYISLFEKRDGKYICIRDMGSSDSPAPKK